MSTSPPAAPVRAAAYYRMSDNRQEHSIERQRAQVEPYAAKQGYQLVKSYEDLGIAGDVFGKRSGLQQLLADAKAGLFSVIVTDEWSRLSRQEPIEFISTVVKPLKDAEVTLDCVAEGTQQWDNLAALILMTVKSSKSQDESKTRSYRTLTGARRAATLGQLLGAQPPYGYTVEYEKVEEPGKPPRMRPVRLVPDRRRVHVVRWIFETYAEGGWSMDAMAIELNARAVEAPPPGGKGGRATKDRKRGEPCPRWTRNTVRAILKNPRYTGALVWNRRSRGKYHRLHDGAVIPKGKANDVANAPEQWEIVPGSHQALVSQELFDRVQARVGANRGSKPNHGAYLFSGLVTCSHCGRTLSGITCKGRRVYRCHRYDQAGEVVCGYNAVAEEWLLDRIIQVIQEQMLAPGRLEALREEIRRQDEAARVPEALGPIEKRVEELEAWIKQGNKNLALLPEDRLTDVVLTIREWERERGRLFEEMARRKVGELGSLDDMIEGCESLLWRLRDAVATADPLLLREVVREMVARVELAWGRRPYGTNGRTRYIVRSGVIHLRPQADLERNTLRCTGTRAAAPPTGRRRPRRSASAPR